MSAIQIMNEEEIQRAESISSESGFGCISTALGNLPVKALNLKTKITGLVYETTVRQTYVNRYNRPLEATYIFPLPDRGAVGDFKMIVGGREIDGVLKERGQARREYKQAIESGHRASIVEEERPDTFSMRVGNVEAGEEITIEFKVTGPLIFADGEATFRFPLWSRRATSRAHRSKAATSVTARRRTPTRCRTLRASRRRSFCQASLPRSRFRSSASSLAATSPYRTCARACMP